MLYEVITAEGPNRRAVVAEGFELEADPARNLRTADIGETCKLRKICDRHDAGDNRDDDTGCPAVVDEAEVGIGAIKVLRNSYNFV